MLELNIDQASLPPADASGPETWNLGTLPAGSTGTITVVATLPGCDAAKCNCRYEYYPDRRVPDDRRAAFSMNSDLYTVAGRRERRAANGRRKVDLFPGKASEYDFKELNPG